MTNFSKNPNIEYINSDSQPNIYAKNKKFYSNIRKKKKVRFSVGFYIKSVSAVCVYVCGCVCEYHSAANKLLQMVFFILQSYPALCNLNPICLISLYNFCSFQFGHTSYSILV